MTINANERTPFENINRQIRETSDAEITVNGCIGQRYIGTGLRGKKVTVYGTAGNALGAYLDGGELTVYGNGQDAIGDTMNDGSIIIHGNAGDATGYAMRGGKIYIKGDTGYRSGIHMKEFMTAAPVLVVGGRAGSFLGEYQAGGTIVVLGAGGGDRPIVNHFTGIGMHGGAIYLRGNELPFLLPPHVKCERRRGGDVASLAAIIEDYCSYFDCFDARKLLGDIYCELTPDAQNPTLRMYVDN